jgi:hypothetical protein
MYIHRPIAGPTDAVNSLDIFFGDLRHELATDVLHRLQICTGITQTISRRLFARKEKMAFLQKGSNSTFNEMDLTTSVY